MNNDFFLSERLETDLSPVLSPKQVKNESSFLFHPSIFSVLLTPLKCYSMGKSESLMAHSSDFNGSIIDNMRIHAFQKSVHTFIDVPNKKFR